MVNKEATRGKTALLKTLCVVLAIILMIGIATIVALTVHDLKGNAQMQKVENGLSAYELAVQHGYEGTVQEWLDSLSGKSAYEIAVENGYTGSESEWATALQASIGQDGVSISTAAFSEKGELLITLSDGTVLNLGKAVGADGKDGVDGMDGKNGVNGTKGKDGADGKEGVGITKADINDAGQLVLTFSDGETVNLDKIVGMNGQDGVGVAKSEINSNGELVLTYTNGQTANLGNVIGAAGKDGVDGTVGADGKDGADGISITNATVSASGELVLTYSNGNSANLGVVVGANGSDGKDGTDGAAGSDGKDGQDGVSVTTAEINSEGQLVLSFSNGQRTNLGNVIGAAGKDGADGKDGVDGANGISVTKTEINSKGELLITYSTGRIDNLGVIVGVAGKDGVNGSDGKDGADGKDGVGIQSIVITDGNLEIALTNGTTLDLGNIKGADGADGKDGINGTDGEDGVDGIGITKTEINTAGELVITYSDGKSTNLGKIAGIDGEDGQDGIGISKTEINASGEMIVTYTDGTSTNLGKVAGIDGADGEDGIGIAKTEINTAGELVVTYTDGNSTNLGKVIGTDGTGGVDGTDGVGISSTNINAAGELVVAYTDGTTAMLGKVVGTNGIDGKDGEDGIGISETSINSLGELIITYSNGKSTNLGKVAGIDGQDGTDGVDGTDGKDGTDGIGVAQTEINASGELVITYTDGKSTNLGKVVGNDGATGKDGSNGTDGIDGEDGVGITKAEINSDGQLVLYFSNDTSINLGNIVGADGTNGADGKDGVNGINGKDGADGVGIKNVTISAEGILSVELTNGTVLNLGNVKGTDGIGISKSEINNAGELILTYTDGNSTNLGKVTGADGKDGRDGVGIANVNVSAEGELTVTLTDMTVLELGNIKGAKGDKGDTGATGAQGPQGEKGETGETGAQGPQGEKGEQGKDGVSVVNAYINDEMHLILVMSDGEEIDAGYVGTSSGDSGESTATYTVTFKNYDSSVLKTQTVQHGGNATPPTSPTRDGYTFAGWSGSYTNIIADVTLVAQFVPIESVTYTVTFVDYDGTVLKTQVVEEGEAATAPADPARDGYTFTGWDKDSSNITSDLTVTAQYEVDGPAIYVSSASADVGDTVQIIISVKNSPSIVSAKLNIAYDESVMTLTKVTNGSAMTGLSYTGPKNMKSGCNAAWFSTGDAVALADGEMLVLTFTILNEATSGEYLIDISYDKSSTLDGNYEEITYNTDIKGKITIN